MARDDVVADPGSERRPRRVALVAVVVLALAIVAFLVLFRTAAEQECDARGAGDCIPVQEG